MLQHAEEKYGIGIMGSRYDEICKLYFRNIITCSKKNLPDLTHHHPSFRNGTSAGLAK
jgi:hypothetical protein